MPTPPIPPAHHARTPDPPPRPHTAPAQVATSARPSAIFSRRRTPPELPSPEQLRTSSPPSTGAPVQRAPEHWRISCTHTECTLHQVSPYIGKLKVFG